jgi:hypothetical protein
VQPAAPKPAQPPTVVTVLQATPKLGPAATIKPPVAAIIASVFNFICLLLVLEGPCARPRYR